MNARLRFLAPIAATFVLATCTDGTQRDGPDVVTGSAMPTPRPDPSPSASAENLTDAGRLAVIDDRGNLVTLAPDGTDPVVVAEAVEGRTVVRQPTWSPDAERLAWVRLEATEGGFDASVVTMAGDGTRPTEAPTEVAPFYLSWDPTSSRIAYLGSLSASKLELGIVDVAGGGREAMPLDAGAPYYFSWNPAGEQMLVHVGTDRLETLRLDGRLESVNDRPGTFNAPVWTTDGRSVVYASTKPSGQGLIVQDVGKERGRELVRFDGIIRFVVSPDSSRVAFQVLSESGEVEPLFVVDRDTRTFERVAGRPAPAFFWSPEGDRLLFLFPEGEADRVWLRWGIWDGASTFTTPRFLPSPVFAREYLQFFDQYAQSMSLWAPDGSAFTYAGASESGEQGIWVQPARSGADPVLVAEGVFAAWSPA